MTPTLRDTLTLIRSDMLARARYEKKPLTKRQVLKWLVFNASLATVVYRLQVWLFRRDWRVAAMLLKTFNGVFLTVEIDSRTEIGAGFFLMHANFITIGARVVIGRNCMMAHQNSIGASPFCAVDHDGPGSAPRLGDDVMLGAGACVVGDLVLGDRIQISMNAAVDQSFGDDVTLFGVPARILGKQGAAAAASLSTSSTSSTPEG